MHVILYDCQSMLFLPLNFNVCSEISTAFVHSFLGTSKQPFHLNDPDQVIIKTVATPVLTVRVHNLKEGSIIVGEIIYYSVSLI